MSATPDIEPLDLERLIFEAGKSIISVEKAMRILPMLEPTSLNDEDSIDDIEALCKSAETPVGNTAAVCVLPRYVETAFNALRHNTVKIATVINFPDGLDDIEDIADTTEDVVNAGAQEVDIVFPYQAFLEGNFDHVRDVLQACRNACGQNTLVKVILETGALISKENIQAATHMAIASEADFIKTSTGTIQKGATLEATAYILEVIHLHHLKNPENAQVGLKVSGGLRNGNTVAQFLKLADLIMGEDWADTYTMRFGASKLLNEILETIGEPKIDD